LHGQPDAGIDVRLADADETAGQLPGLPDAESGRSLPRADPNALRWRATGSGCIADRIVVKHGGTVT
jgi:hypothetical protein